MTDENIIQYCYSSFDCKIHIAIQYFVPCCCRPLIQGQYDRIPIFHDCRSGRTFRHMRPPHGNPDMLGNPFPDDPLHVLSHSKYIAALTVQTSFFHDRQYSRINNWISSSEYGIWSLANSTRSSLPLNTQWHALDQKRGIRVGLSSDILLRFSASDINCCAMTSIWEAFRYPPNIIGYIVNNRMNVVRVINHFESALHVCTIKHLTIFSSCSNPFQHFRR